MIFTLSRASPMNSFSEEDFAKFPICVDLDGTLWAGDCLWLSLSCHVYHDTVIIII